MKRFALPILAALAILTFAWAQSTRVGPVPTADSLAVNTRLGRNGESITQSAGGTNKERARRGTLFFASDTGTGAAPGTALGNSAHLVLYNPKGSSVVLIVHKVWDVYLSGTLGTGVMYHVVNGDSTQTVPSGGTLLTNFSAYASTSSGAQGVVRMGGTVAGGGMFAPFFYMAPELATSVTSPQQTFEDLQDGIVLPPGTSYQLQAVAAAGTSPKLSPAICWEEQALLNGQP